MSLVERCLSLSTLALLCACGGGADVPLRPQADRGGLASPSAPVPVSTAEEMLLNWAERRHPDLFAPGAVTQEVFVDGRRFSARTYPATGNHLGMVFGGMVFGLGAFTGGALKELGSFENFLCEASPADCSPRPARPMRVRIDAGSLQCEPGTGTSRLDARRGLTQAGIAVSGSDCGYGSFGVPAACGFQDGRYWMFVIDEADAARAAALGYLPLDPENYPGTPSAWACSY